MRASAAEQGVIAFLGVGSNRGDSLGNCRTALDRLARLPDLTLLRYSSPYRTQPKSMTEQPWFINAVAEVRARMSPPALLEALEMLEESMGRRDKGTGGPRVIDLDILLFGQAVYDDGRLTVPHREMHRRRFVLLPLHEIAPYAIHPLFGISVRGLLERLDDEGIVEIIGDRSDCSVAGT